MQQPSKQVLKVLLFFSLPLDYSCFFFFSSSWLFMLLFFSASWFIYYSFFFPVLDFFSFFFFLGEVRWEKSTTYWQVCKFEALSNRWKRACNLSWRLRCSSHASRPSLHAEALSAKFRSNNARSNSGWERSPIYRSREGCISGPDQFCWLRMCRHV